MLKTIEKGFVEIDMQFFGNGLVYKNRGMYILTCIIVIKFKFIR